MRTLGRILGISLAVALTAALLASVAASQGPQGGGPTATTAPTTATTPTSTTSVDDQSTGSTGNSALVSATGTTEGDDSHSGLGAGVLIFGFFVIVALLVYLGSIQGKYYRASEGIVDLGKVPKVISVRAIESDRDGVAPPEIEIDGPAMIAVGEAAQFKAVSGESAQAVDWTIERTDGGTESATLDPASGAETKLTAPAAGDYKLIASQNGQKRAEATIRALVPQAEADSGQTVGIPFVGEGYGTLVVAVVVVSVAGALGFVGVLDGSALATLFGAIAGYIFVKASGGSSDGSSSSSAGTPTQS